MSENPSGFQSEDPISPPKNPRTVAQQPSRPRKKSGGPVGFILFILLVGGAVAGLHFTGNLAPLIEKIKAKLPSKTGNTPEQTDIAVTEGEQKPETGPKQVVADAADLAEPSDKEIEEIIKARKNEDPDSIEAQYRARFRPPAKGTPVMINNDKALSGRLAGVTPDGVWLNNGKAEYMVPVSVMDAVSLARFYEDSYVAFMSYVQRQMEANAKSRAERSAQMQAAYAQHSSGKTSHTSSSTKTASKSSSPSKATLKEGDLRQWMQDSGASNMLQQRQARIRAYEKERAKDGGAH